MSRAVPRIVVLSLVVAVVAAAPAIATQRYASPTGTGPVGSCPQNDPCSIANAVLPSSTEDGDEVILAAGDYVSPPELDIIDAVDVHGLGSPSQTRIVSTATAAVFLGNAGAKLRNVEISHSSGLSSAVYVSSGTVSRVIAKSSSASGCEVRNATIRDSICASSASGSSGVFINHSGVIPYSIILRNVTAIGSGGVNSSGIFAGAGVGTSVTFDAKSVIARGTSYGVYASTGGAGSSSTVTLDHSNYANPYAVGTATITATSANNNQTAAPVFVNEAAGDYHQATGSPTIDAGAVDVASGSTDVDGEARNQGSAPDIGADEFEVPPLAPSITSPSSGFFTADTTPAVSGTAEANSTVNVYVDGNPAGTTSADGSGNWTLDLSPALIENTFVITATATDAAVTTSPASSPVTLTVDVTAPSASISSPVNGRLYNGDPVALTYNATDTNPGTTECQVDGAAYGTCEASLNLPDGGHTVNVRHTDAAGNVGTANATFTVDSTPPQTRIRKGPKAKTANRKAKFTFLSGEAGSTFKCKLDRGAFKPCKSPFTKRVKPGKHVFRVVSSDAAGNPDATPAVYRWKVLAG